MLDPRAVEDFTAAVETVDRVVSGEWPAEARASLVATLLLESSRKQSKWQGRGEGQIELPPDKVAVRVSEATAAGPLAGALRKWRRELAKHDGVPPYTIFHDKTLLAIAETRPATVEALTRLRGIGPQKAAKYGADVLRLVAMHNSQIERPAVEATDETITQAQHTIVAALRGKRMTETRLAVASGLPAHIFSPALAKLEKAGTVVEQDDKWRVVKK